MPEDEPKIFTAVDQRLEVLLRMADRLPDVVPARRYEKWERENRILLTDFTRAQKQAFNRRGYKEWKKVNRTLLSDFTRPQKQVFYRNWKIFHASGVDIRPTQNDILKGGQT